MSVLDVVDDVLDKAATLEVWSLSDDDLGEAMRRCEALAARQAALGLRLLREADARDLGRRQGASSTTGWLRDTPRLRPGVAKARVELANRLDATDAAPTDFAVNVEAGRRRQATMPVTAQALAAGAVSVDHATVIAHTLAELPTDLDPDETSRAESDLAGFARVHDPAIPTRLGAHLVHVLSAESSDDREQRAVRARRLTFTDLGDGSVRLSGRLDTEDAAAVRTALDPLAAPRPATDGERDPRRPDRRLADALVELASRHLDTGDLPSGHGIRPTSC